MNFVFEHYKIKTIRRKYFQSIDRKIISNKFNQYFNKKTTRNLFLTTYVLKEGIGRRSNGERGEREAVREGVCKQ